MKNIALKIVTLFLLINSTALFSQRPPVRPRMAAREIVITKIHAHRVIRRTAGVINIAYIKVKENKNYTGDLARAVAHQRFARKLYRRGMYLRAIHHSRVGRIYAIKAIKANKGADSNDYSFTAEEEELMKNPPSDQALMDELTKDDPAQSNLKDQNVDVKDIDLDEKE